MSSLNVAVVLTLITGLGGAIAGSYVFRAPWWSWPIMGIAGLFVGLFAAILQNQFRLRFLEKTEDKDCDKDKGVLSGLCFVTKLILPFIAVILVTIVTVTGSIILTKAIWPDLAADPRDLGRLEGAL